MPEKILRVPTASRLFDPARSAARLLGWIGMSVLMVGAPLAGVLSRTSLFVLLPVGAGLLVAAFLLSVSARGLRTFVVGLLHPIGLAAAFLFGWAALSLVWTPFPGEVGPQFAATLATALSAGLIIAHMPEGRALKALYLLPAGVAATSLATLAMAYAGPGSFRGGSEFDPSLLQRSVLTLALLVWPALGALATFGRWPLAMGLAILVAVTLTVTGASLAMAVFVFAALAFAFAVDHPRLTGRAAGLLFAGLIVVGPLLPFVLAPLAAALPPVGRSTVAAMADWRELVADDGLRLVTGHGLGTAFAGVGSYMPVHTPRTVLFQLWYELGVLGALALAASLVFGFAAAGRAAAHAAPALLGGMVATLSVEMFGVATGQLWLVSLVSLQAVAFGLLCRSSRSGPRPAVPDAMVFASPPTRPSAPPPVPPAVPTTSTSSGVT